jgi:pSer/pThr/pTyr-binding forkhead associated (FHA) protein
MEQPGKATIPTGRRNGYTDGVKETSERTMNVKLLVVQGKPAGKSIPFPPGDYMMGRGPECYLRFNSEWVSRQHCVLRVGLEQALLRDLGSRNGTLVNGVLLAGDHVLAQGDHIQLGPVVFEVFLEEGPGGPAGSSTTLLPPSDAAFPTFGRNQGDSTATHPPLLDKD